MTQYPNEKDPHSDWVYPGQQQGYAAPGFPPPNQPPYAYTSRDGAPGQSASYAGYAPPPQAQYHAPPPPQGYYPPQGPPPDYGYAETHPDSKSTYDQKGAGAYPHETVLSPPPSGPYDASAPSAGPSSSHDDGHGGVMMSIGSFFGNKGPPPMWQRQAPLQLPYTPFPPMCLISNKSELSNGFPELPPPCQVNPHPFATHDVTEEDWKRFLSDVKRAGSLSGAQRIKSNVIPMVTGMSFFSGFMATMAIERKMKYNNRTAAGDLVDHWNHYFFGPRRMEVVLSQASERLSGKLGTAPVGDPNQERMANGLRQHSDDDESDDSSEDDGHGHSQGNHGSGFQSDRRTRRAARRERRAERRAKRQERRDWKARGDNKQPYQLFITAI